MARKQKRRDILASAGPELFEAEAALARAMAKLEACDALNLAKDLERNCQEGYLKDLREKGEYIRSMIELHQRFDFD